MDRATVGELRGTVEREGAAIGVLITLKKPTRPMLDEAAAAGFYDSPWGGSYPRLQVLTVEGLMHRTQRLEMPAQERTATTFKQSPRESGARPLQPGLGVE